MFDKIRKLKIQKRVLIVFLLLFIIGVIAVFRFFAQKDLIPEGIGVNDVYLEGQERFSTEEKTLLKVPSQGVSQAEKDAHFAVVNRLARSAEFLDLSTCYGSPLAFRAQEGTTFTVKNSAATEHTLQISPTHIYTIPAKGERKLTARFGFGPGVYGYGCDNSPDARGILFVTK